ncbi:MAG TPA: deoxyribonuclease IV [Gaiellaceae bacterium]|nr:deoxyribonuclease IV [Gaiellaceae bacterium]
MEFGAHMSSAGGIYTAIDRIEAIGGECVQVFTQSPRMWKPTAHTPEAIERFKTRRAEAGIGGVVCHALYLCNLAAPDEVIYGKSVAALRATVETANAIEADAVIFHVGSHLGAGFEAVLDKVAAALAEILVACDGGTWLAMENSAGPGGTIGRSIAELATLVDALERHPRLGICLDSCHLYASGYDVTDPAAVDALVAEVDETIGLGRLRALHVNDSLTPLGSNRDRHANILEGELGEGLGAFLVHPAFQGLAAYLEVEGSGSGPDANELGKLRTLHARWTSKRDAGDDR